MDEMIREWLKQMYDREIEEAQGTLSNEKLWMIGSETKEEEAMHLDNMAQLNEYIVVLKEKRGEL